MFLPLFLPPFFPKMCQSESESPSVVSDSLQLYGLYSPWNSVGQNTGVGSRSLLQGIFLTQGSNPGLPHCRQILYHLSHQGSPGSLSLLQGIFVTPPYLRLKITGRERNRAQCTLQLNVTKLMNLGETSGTAQLTDKSMRNNKSLLL